MNEISTKIRPALVSLEVGEKHGVPHRKDEKCSNTSFRTGNDSQPTVQNQNKSGDPHDYGYTSFVE
mgnify:CR=1 FL=1